MRNLPPPPPLAKRSPLRAAPLLSAALRALTGKACPGCPPPHKQVPRLFPSDKALLAHVRAEHSEKRRARGGKERGGGGESGTFSATLCSLCLEQGKEFTRSLTVFGEKAVLRSHLDTEHPACQFCRVEAGSIGGGGGRGDDAVAASDSGGDGRGRGGSGGGGSSRGRNSSALVPAQPRRFFSADDLYAHMRTDHFNCHVCLSQTGKHFYLRDARSLIDHLRRQHFFCDEPVCEGAMAAFATREELEQHARAVHLGRNMPRFDRRTARPLSLLGEHHGGGGGIGGGGRGGYNGNAFPELRQQSSIRRAGGGAQAPPPTSSGGGGGFSLVDDDEQLARRHGHRRDMPVSSSYSNANAAAASGSREAFPALGVGGGGNAAAAAPTSTSSSQPPPLVRVTSRCPCGRRASHQAVPLGTAAPALACDAACSEARRAAALADAFGIDRKTHVSVFDRDYSCFVGGSSSSSSAAAASSVSGAFRPGNFEPELLYWAWHHRAACSAIEQALAEFVSSGTKRREALPPLPFAEDRQAVHMLARHYGLASQSAGEGPRRRVELFKVGEGGGGSGSVGGRGGANGFYGETSSYPSSSSSSFSNSNGDGFFPPSLLSTTANRLTLADVERAGYEAKGYALCLVDVEPRADLSYLLRRFAESGLLKAVEGPDERGSAIVRFTKAAGLREALDQLGGGMRGAFRIDRTATLRANQAVLGIPASSAAPAPQPPPPPPPSSIYRDLDPHDRMAAIEAAFSATSISSGSRGGGGGRKGNAGPSSSGNNANAPPPSAAAVAAAAVQLGNGWKLASDFDWADDE